MRRSEEWGKLEGAWREAGVLNSHVKPPLWPIHEWNGTSGQRSGGGNSCEALYFRMATCARARARTYTSFLFLYCEKRLKLVRTHREIHAALKTAILRSCVRIIKISLRSSQLATSHEWRPCFRNKLRHSNMQHMMLHFSPQASIANKWGITSIYFWVFGLSDSLNYIHVTKVLDWSLIEDIPLLSFFV